MVSRIVLILLFPVAWPIYFVIWCWRHPEELRHALYSGRDVIRAHPKRAAWLGVVFGVIGLIGHLADGEFLAMGVGAAVAGWCGWLLIKWKRQERGASATGNAAGERSAAHDAIVRADTVAAEVAERDATGEDSVGASADEESAPVPSAATEATADARLEYPGIHDALFVYGTLQFPEVVRELLGRNPRSVPKTLEGWRVAALPGRVYPGLVPDAAGVAHGMLLTGLTAREWEVLDAFEDVEYELRRIGDGESTVAYVWTADVAAQDWHPADFAATHLASFVTECEQWRTAS